MLKVGDIVEVLPEDDLLFPEDKIYGKFLGIVTKICGDNIYSFEVTFMYSKDVLVKKCEIKNVVTEQYPELQL